MVWSPTYSQKSWACKVRGPEEPSLWTKLVEVMNFSWAVKSTALIIPANLENSAVATGLEKVSFHSNPKEGPCQNMLKYHTIALISHASKVMLKTLWDRLQHYMNCELPDVEVDFRKVRRTRDQVANICWIIEKERIWEKYLLCFIDYAKAFDCVDHNKLENYSRDGSTRPPYLPPAKSVCRSGSNS